MSSAILVYTNTISFPYGNHVLSIACCNHWTVVERRGRKDTRGKEVCVPCLGSQSESSKAGESALTLWAIKCHQDEHIFGQLAISLQDGVPLYAGSSVLAVSLYKPCIDVEGNFGRLGKELSICKSRISRPQLRIEALAGVSRSVGSIANYVIIATGIFSVYYRGGSLPRYLNIHVLTAHITQNNVDGARFGAANSLEEKFLANR